MTRPYGPMYRDFLALRAELASLDEKLKSLKSISSSPVGCVTFTANHGSSVMSQIRGEIDSLANIMARRRLRTLEGGSIDTRILNTTDSALISYVKSNPAEVPEGSVRQYFVEESRAVCEVIEFPSNYLQIRIGKGQAASTHGMLRLKSFNTTSLESFVNSKRKKHSSTEAQIKHSVEETLLKSTNSSVATNMWSK